MKIVKLIDDIELSIKPGNIGIFVSGGADSAILLLCVMSNLEKDQKLVILTTHSDRKGRSNVKNAGQIIEYCIQKTGFNNIIHLQQFVDYQNVDILFSPVNSIKQAFELKQIFTGITCAPPKNITDFFKGINGDINNRYPDVMRSTVDGIYELPFINKNKKFISQLYDFMNASDLFHLTRSCEKLSEIPIDYHCGECWWCEERFWAFGKL